MSWKLILMFLSYAAFIEYRFYKNHGKIIKDYSENQNHGVNGLSIDDDVKDSIFTDRGVYLSEESMVSVANSDVVSDFVHPNDFKLVFWVKSLDGNTNSLLYSVYSSTMSMQIYHDKLLKLICVIIIQDQIVTFCNCNQENIFFEVGNTYLGIWALLTFEILFSAPSIKISINSLNEDIELLSPYQITISEFPSSFTEYFLGTKFSASESENFSGFKGFVGYFALYMISENTIAYLYNSESTNCLIGNCDSCNPSFIIPDLGIGCGSKVDDLSTDSFGISCQGDLPCKGNMKIKCLCSSNSCEFTIPGVCTCLGVNGYEKKRSGCYFTDGGQGECNLDCLECENQNGCTKCFSGDSNLKNGKCECKDGFYRTGLITSSDSCISCATECKTCDNYSSCKTCKSDNAYVQGDKCFCNEGYFKLETNCEKCLTECKTCENSSSCLTCSDKNALLLNGRCICPSGYYEFSSISSFSCHKCSKECETCSSKSFCLSCSDISKTLIKGKCFCKSGYFESGSQKTCKKCLNECKTCTNSFSCSKCLDDSAVIIDGKCKCPKGFFLSSKLQCEPCLAECESCSEAKTCFKCKDSNSFLKNSRCFCNDWLLEVRQSGVLVSCEQCPENQGPSEGSCVCLKGFVEVQGTCVQSNFSVNLSTNSQNLIKVEFEEALLEYLHREDLELSFSDSLNFSYILIRKTRRVYYLKLKINEDIPKNAKVFLRFLREIYSEKNKKLLKKRFSADLKEVDLNQDENSKGSYKGFQIWLIIIVATSLGMSLVSNPSPAWLLLGSIQLFSYIPVADYFQDKYSIDLLNSLGLLKLCPNPFELVMSPSSSSPAYKGAQKIEIESSVFLINSGSLVALLAGFLISWPFLIILKRLSTGKLFQKLSNVLKKFKFNVFIRFWIQSFLDIGFFAVFFLKSNFSHSEEEFYVNLALSGVFLVGFSFTSLLIFLMNYKNYQKIVDGNEKFLKKYGEFFDEFKNDRGFFSTFYYFLFILRRQQFLVTQVFLNISGVAQIVLNLLFSMITLWFLAYFKPFKEKSVLFLSIEQEFNFLSIFLMLLYSSISGRKIKSVIFHNIVFGIVLAGLIFNYLISLFHFFSELKKIYIKARDKYKVKIIEEKDVVDEIK